jgi:hypothetical protein
MSTVTVLLRRANDIRFDVKDKTGKECSLIIKGANAKIKDINGLVIPSSPIPFGDTAYGITPNVDADLWAEVVKLYGNSPLFERGVIIATTPKQEKEAREEIAEVEKTDDPIIVTEGEDVDKPKRGRKKKA